MAKMTNFMLYFYYYNKNTKERRDDIKETILNIL